MISSDSLTVERRYAELAVETYSKMLFRICVVILCNSADAEDAVQETFLRYLTKAPAFTSPEHEKAWLIKVATNISKNMARFKRRHSSLSLEDITETAVDKKDTDAFRSILELPGKYKIVMDLYYIEGYRASEISSIIGVSADTVRKRLQHGRELLRLEFERSDSQ